MKPQRPQGSGSGLGSLLAEHWPTGAVISDRAARAALVHGAWSAEATVVLLPCRDDVAEFKALADAFSSPHK
eukprot:990300-Alexandrium_andersonii.AAC.1